MGVLLIFRSLGLIGQVAINLGCGQMLVSQQFLNFPQICSTVDQMGGIGVSQGVGTGPFVEACSAHISIENFANGPVRDSLAKAVEQNRDWSPVSIFRDPL